MSDPNLGKPGGGDAMESVRTQPWNQVMDEADKPRGAVSKESTKKTWASVLGGSLVAYFL